jgi:glycosyltransferase involved in cell wall biosynthesis
MQASKHMKHVAIVVPFGNQQGGAEAMLMYLLRENVASPLVDFSCFFLKNGPMVDYVKAMGYRVTVIDAGRLSDLRRYARTVWRLRREMHRQGVESVLSWMTKAQLYAGPASLGLGVQVFWFQHGITSGGWMDRLAGILPTTAIFAYSKTAATAQLKISPRRYVLVCYPAVDLARLEQARQMGQAYWRSQLGIPVNVPVIGMVARMERWKGIDVFIRAAIKLAQQHPNLHAFVVGGEHPLDPDYACELRDLAKQAGLGDRLRLAGQRPLEEVAGWWCACDVALHSNIGAEPFGMGIVEAMAMERPVCASALGGPMESIQNGVNGFLCAPNDADGLVRVVQDLLADPERRQALGRTARRRANDFSPRALLLCLANGLSGKSCEAAL